MYGCNYFDDNTSTATIKKCGRADLRILEWVRVKIMDLD